MRLPDPRHLVSLLRLRPPVPERRPFFPAQKHYWRSVAEPACRGQPAGSRRGRERPRHPHGAPGQGSEKPGLPSDQGDLRRESDGRFGWAVPGPSAHPSELLLAAGGWPGHLGHSGEPTSGNRGAYPGKLTGAMGRAGHPWRRPLPPPTARPAAHSQGTRSESSGITLDTPTT